MNRVYAELKAAVCLCLSALSLPPQYSMTTAAPRCIVGAAVVLLIIVARHVTTTLFPRRRALHKWDALETHSFRSNWIHTKAVPWCNGRKKYSSNNNGSKLAVLVERSFFHRRSFSPERGAIKVYRRTDAGVQNMIIFRLGYALGYMGLVRPPGILDVFVCIRMKSNLVNNTEQYRLIYVTPLYGELISFGCIESSV